MQPTPNCQYLDSLIAGGIAIAGIVVGHVLTMLTTWHDRKHKRTALLLSKLDDWTVALDDARGWLIAQEQSKTLADIQAKPFLGCDRLQALTILYFPDLEPFVANYMKSLKEYYLWIIECMVSLGPDGRLTIPLATWLRMSDQYSSQTQAHCDAIIECHKNLIEATQHLAQKLLG
jgi:hypothetical protein